jgi:hypothetical protein
LIIPQEFNLSGVREVAMSPWELLLLAAVLLSPKAAASCLMGVMGRGDEGADRGEDWGGEGAVSAPLLAGRFRAACKRVRCKIRLP